MILQYKGILLCIVSIFLLSACLPRHNIEDISLVQVVGYDVADDGLIRGTASVPQFARKEQGNQVRDQILTTTAHSTKQIHTKLQAKSSRPISIGTLKVALYSEELAKQGIGSIVDSMARDPRINQNLYLAITREDTRDILNAGFSKDQPIGQFISGLIKENAASNLPATNLHEYLSSHFGEGYDSFLPYLKLNDDQELALGGIAFFDDGKFVHFIPYERSFSFTLMKENFKEATQEIKFKNHYIVVESIYSKVKYLVKGDKDNLQITIDISMTGIINDAPTQDFEITPKIMREMEQTIEKYNLRKAEKMIKEFQSIGIDPLGLGYLVSTRKKGINLNRWKESYPDIPIDVKLKMTLIEVGTTS